MFSKMKSFHEMVSLQVCMFEVSVTLWKLCASLQLRVPEQCCLFYLCTLCFSTLAWWKAHVWPPWINRVSSQSSRECQHWSFILNGFFSFLKFFCLISSLACICHSFHLLKRLNEQCLFAGYPMLSVGEHQRGKLLLCPPASVLGPGSPCLTVCMTLGMSLSPGGYGHPYSSPTAHSFTIISISSLANPAVSSPKFVSPSVFSTAGLFGGYYRCTMFWEEGVTHMYMQFLAFSWDWSVFLVLF